VKARDLLYKNPINVYLKMNVFIGKGGNKLTYKLNTISYTIDNQEHIIDF